MQILIDDLPCELNANTVGEAIDGASDLARDRGRLIVDVTVDGAKWTQADLASTQKHAQTAHVVRFSSAEPVELVRDTFADAIDALTDADDLQREAAELLQSNKGTVAMDKLGEAIAIWLCVQEALVNGTRLVGLDLATMTVGGKPLPEAIGRLSDRLNAVRSGLSDRNEIELADTLLYDFPPIVAEWRCLLAELQERIAVQGESGE
jgi:hypothetical protein